MKRRLTILENMLGSALRDACGPLKDLLEKLMGPDGLWWLNALKKFLRRENPFTEENAEIEYFELREMWKRIYRKHFRVRVNFTDLHIPKCPGAESDYWLIIVAKGMSMEKIFLACKKAFGAWRWTYNNLDKIVESITHPSVGSFALWVRARVEADEEFKNLSANKVKEQGHKGIALKERMLLEIMYFEQTGKHLDIHNITLCTGSQVYGNHIVSVRFDNDINEMVVSRYHNGYAGDNFRSRKVF